MNCSRSLAVNDGAGGNGPVIDGGNVASAAAKAAEEKAAADAKAAEEKAAADAKVRDLIFLSRARAESTRQRREHASGLAVLGLPFGVFAGF